MVKCESICGHTHAFILRLGHSEKICMRNNAILGPDCRKTFDLKILYGEKIWSQTWTLSRYQWGYIGIFDHIQLSASQEKHRFEELSIIQIMWRGWSKRVSSYPHDFIQEIPPLRMWYSVQPMMYKSIVPSVCYSIHNDSTIQILCYPSWK